mgnify:FL=1
MAYGIRNVQDRPKAIAEMARVTKPSGRIMILETGDTQWPGFAGLYKFYFSQVIPRIGGLITGKRSAYEYLNQSSAQFPSGDNFIELLKSSAAFSECRFWPLMAGASYIYSAQVATSSALRETPAQA